MLRRPRPRSALLLALPAIALLLLPGRSTRDPVSTAAPDLSARSYRVVGDVLKDEPGPSPYPSDWAWLRRTSPHGQASADAFREALAQARALKFETRGGNQLLLQPVLQAGPSNVGGRISDIEWHPTDPSILYAGSATGGVFKSVDTGITWTPVGDDIPNLNVGDLVIDPSNPETVWLGTGEANGGHNNFPGGGVYRTNDGGATWSFMGLGNTASVGRVLVDPTDSQTVFVAAQGSYFGPNAERGVYRTRDGGVTWQRVLFVTDSTAATDIVMDPSNPDRLMASMWERVRRPNGGTHLTGPTSGIWRSVDGGDTWANLGPSQGLPNPSLTSVGRIGLALCASNPDVVYTLITNASFPIGVWRTIDFGDTWVNQDLDQEVQAAAFGFSWYFGQIRVAPDDCDRIYALDGRLMHSSDAGFNFATSSAPVLHVDHHALAFHPTNSDFIFEGNDGGLVYSMDAGVTWDKAWILPNVQFYEIGLDPSDPNRRYGGTQDNGTIRTVTGLTNDWEGVFGGDGFYVNVDPRDSDVIYAESQFGNLYKTVDGGSNWSPARPPLAGDRVNWSTPVELDALDPDVLYYGSQRVWRSADAGTTWAAVSGDLTKWVPGAVLGTITTMSISEVENSILWVGTDDGNVWRGLRDTSGTFIWNDVTQPNLPNRWVTRVVAHPSDSLAAWATFNGLKWMEDEGHVYYTTDGGVSWTDISTNLPDAPVNALVVDPLNPTVVFVGSDLGAYYTDDNGGHWTYLSPDLPMVSVYDMAIHPTARYLAIGTHGRSMYTMDLGVLVAVDPPRAVGASLAQNFPNPVRANTTFDFALVKAGLVRLELFDAAGRRVRTLASGAHAAGRHQLTWDGRDDHGRMLRSGNYRYRLTLAGGESFTRSLVVVR